MRHAREHYSDSVSGESLEAARKTIQPCSLVVTQGAIVRLVRSETRIVAGEPRRETAAAETDTGNSEPGETTDETTTGRSPRTGVIAATARAGVDGMIASNRHRTTEHDSLEVWRVFSSPFRGFSVHRSSTLVGPTRRRSLEMLISNML